MNLALATLVVLALPGPQPPKKDAPADTRKADPPGTKSVPPGGDPPPPRPPTVIPVGPMPLPSPLLQYDLWFAQSDAGDALPLYLAAMRALPRMNPEQVKEYNAAYELISEKTPKQATPADLTAVRKALDPAAGALKLAARAARVRRCDWSPLVPPLPAPIMPNIEPLLESVQGFRELAFYFRARGYLARAAGDHAAALSDAATTLGMARHLNENETVIGYLVGVAVAQIAWGQVRQVTADDNGPNVFGSLAGVPRPVMPCGPSVRREVDGVAGVYPPLARLEGKLTAVEARRLVDEVQARQFALAGGDGAPPKDESLKSLAKMFEGFAARPDAGPARKRLAGLGYAADRVGGMPTEQVFLLDAAVRVRRAADHARLTVALPDGHPLLSPQPAADLTAAEHPAQVGVVLLREMLPVLPKVRHAQVRADYTVTVLQFTETLRAELANPGMAWGPALLDAPLVKASRVGLAVEWDAAGKRFRAPGPSPWPEKFEWVARP